MYFIGLFTHVHNVVIKYHLKKMIFVDTLLIKKVDTKMLFKVLLLAILNHY